MKPISRSFVAAVSGLACALGTAAPVASVVAQQVQVFSSVAIGDSLGFSDGSSISNRNIDKYAKTLSFTPDQTDAAKALLEGYLAETKAASKEMQASMESAFAEFQESQDHKALQEKTGAAQKKPSQLRR